MENPGSLARRCCLVFFAALSSWTGCRPTRQVATRDAAEFVDSVGEWGMVAVGRRADLLLVDANPLDDVANASRPIGVMLRGRWYPKAELQAKLDALAEKSAKDGSE